MADDKAKIKELSERLEGNALLLRKHGICSACGEMMSHHMDEPFASCLCGTTEWSGPFTPYQALEKEIYDKKMEMVYLDINEAKQ